MLINLVRKQYDANVLIVVNNIVKYSPNTVFNILGTSNVFSKGIGSVNIMTIRQFSA